jgi:hypothetical protein
MASHDPAKYRFSTPVYILIYSVLLTAYYIWDCSMSQKSRFKMQTQGITKFRKTFPQLPGCIVENPTFIQTAHGLAGLVNDEVSRSLIYFLEIVFSPAVGGSIAASPTMSPTGS